MKENESKELKIITKGAPNFSNLSKTELNSFFTCLELQIREFYADKRKSNKKKWFFDKISHNLKHFLVLHYWIYNLLYCKIIIVNLIYCSYTVKLLDNRTIYHLFNFLIKWVSDLVYYYVVIHL